MGRFMRVFIAVSLVATTLMIGAAMTAERANEVYSWNDDDEDWDYYDDYQYESLAFHSEVMFFTASTLWGLNLVWGLIGWIKYVARD